jgi:SAM-dependent methyltransferase
LYFLPVSHGLGDAREINSLPADLCLGVSGKDIDMSWLCAWWRRQRFNPGLLGWVANPFYFVRRGLWREVGELAGALTGDVLDVGCGRKPYRELVPAVRYVGLDIDTPTTRSLGAADLFYDGGKFPFADATFDGVFCSQVFEHVFTPKDFLGEIHRILRPGGQLLLTVPFVWDEHEQPRDFARYSSFGLKALLERAGFEVVAQRKSCADARAIAQLASAWLFKVTRTRHRPLNLLAQLAFMAPTNLLGIFAGVLSPQNEDFYLDNVVLARKRNDLA